MRELLTNTVFLSGMVLAATVAGLALDLGGSIRRWRRERARREAATAHLAMLRRRLWSRGEVCPGLETGLGVLVARAERAARGALAAEELALAEVDRLAPGAPFGGGDPVHVSSLAIAADERLHSLLAELRRALPAAAVADLDAAQQAWQEYRDGHVRLCRELPAATDAAWPVRHLASEALAAARIADLEDLRDIASLAP